MSEIWRCNGKQILKGGCVATGIKSNKNKVNTEAWRCTKCKVNFCIQCVSKYENYSDDQDL